MPAAGAPAPSVAAAAASAATAAVRGRPSLPVRCRLPPAPPTLRLPRQATPSASASSSSSSSSSGSSAGGSRKGGCGVLDRVGDHAQVRQRARSARQLGGPLVRRFELGRLRRPRPASPVGVPSPLVGLQEPRRVTSFTWLSRPSRPGPQCEACHQLATGCHAARSARRVTSSLLVVMPHALRAWVCSARGVGSHGGCECAVASHTHPSLPHVTSRPCQLCSAGGSPRGSRWLCRALCGSAQGVSAWQARACMCTVSSGYGHIIYLFTHLYSSPLE
jgi:hypothetical protein